MIYTTRINSNYFTGFQELVDSQIKWKDRVLSVFKIFSYFTVVIPAIVSFYYVMNRNKVESTTDIVARLCLDLPKEIETFSNKSEKSEEGRIHLPSADMIQNSPIEDIHRSWARNINILIGIFASVSFENISFHGTGKYEIRGIVETKRSGVKDNGYIWTAGAVSKLDPITTLADCFTSMRKARSYSDPEGGMIVFRSSSQDKVIKYVSVPPCMRFRNIMFDSTNQQTFLNLIDRNNDYELNSSRGGKFCSTNSPYVVAEKNIQFDENNFYERVVGIISNSNTRYNWERIDNTYIPIKKEDSVIRLIMARRFFYQDLLLRVLNGSCKMNWDQKTLAHYEKIGEDLLNKIS